MTLLTLVYCSLREPAVNIVRDRSFNFNGFKIVLGEGDTAAMEIAIPGALSAQVLKRNITWYET